MTMLAEVGTYVDSNSSGLTLATNLFLGQLPDSPHVAVVLYQGPAAPPTFMMGAAQGTPHAPALEHQRLQVVSRGGIDEDSYTDAETESWRLHRLLTINEVTLSGVRYLAIEPTDVPHPLDEDAQRRISFVTNFTVTKEPSP